MYTVEIFMLWLLACAAGPASADASALVGFALAAQASGGTFRTLFGPFRNRIGAQLAPPTAIGQ